MSRSTPSYRTRPSVRPRCAATPSPGHHRRRHQRRRRRSQPARRAWLRASSCSCPNHRPHLHQLRPHLNQQPHPHHHWQPPHRPQDCSTASRHHRHCAPRLCHGRRRHQRRPSPPHPHRHLPQLQQTTTTTRRRRPSSSARSTGERCPCRRACRRRCCRWARATTSLTAHSRATPLTTTSSRARTCCAGSRHPRSSARHACARSPPSPAAPSCRTFSLPCPSRSAKTATVTRSRCCRNRSRRPRRRGRPSRRPRRRTSCRQRQTRPLRPRRPHRHRPVVARRASPRGMRAPATTSRTLRTFLRRTRRCCSHQAASCARLPPPWPGR
eukprot:Unigene10499_Nuclearia_a/m.32100 Unigene10499_Nuclearia_a/g.32100  ORF Unigene10499_Nuclearia_a/g.32100 Unigene10499_Nuclearia_a/m.32100 type:complete len:326 (-) Unigene10499_Nuclearia_a:431-1408(-)